jgi:UTP--glucose-1-phosphate uridylyltransferase
MGSSVFKAVIPAAGMGTRFLPATKSIPKEMLPIVDKPAIQYVVEEAIRAGLSVVLLITGRNKGALEDHFDRAVELETALEKRGDFEKLSLVKKITELCKIHYVRQGDPLGLGHAVLTAADHVGNETFVVLLGDDLIAEEDHLLDQMLDVHKKFGGSVIALMEVPDSQVSLYGIASVKKTDSSNIVEIIDLVEKPNKESAPSNFAIIGRYVLDPVIFKVLEKTQAGRGGEIQLTDAIRELALNEKLGSPVHGVIFSGRRYDTGDRVNYLKTVVELASSREDIGGEFNTWLKSFVGNINGNR